MQNLRRSVSFIAITASLTITGLPALTFAADANDEETEAVVVTGTRATGRTVLNSAAPIDVITSRDLEATGQTTILESLNRLIPSFNVPAQVQPDLGSITRGAQLRGLDPAYTLVLVNGKRRHTTANINEDGFAGSVATDLSLIPAGAISRIEVLRDGASAVYGSDAIAGVINIILKDGNSPGELTLQSGQTYEGDGDSNIFRIGKGFKIGDRGSLYLAAEIDQQDATIRNSSLKDSYNIYPAIDSSGNYTSLGSNGTIPSGATANPKEATRNDRAWINNGQRRFTIGTFSYNFDYDLTENTQFYSFGTYATRKAYASQNFRTPNTIYNNNASLLEVYPDGFTPFEVTDEDDIEATLGIKGKKGEWNWDLSTTYGQDTIDVSVRRSANYSLTYPGAQTDFYIGQEKYSNQTTNLDLSRKLNLANHDYDFSFGLQQRHEIAQLSAGEPNSYYGSGSSSLVGYLPEDAYKVSRDSWGTYIGLATNVNEKWFVDTAVRYEDYDDYGDSTTGRISTRYEFTPDFAIRATISNAFHAPNLITQSYTNTSDHAGTSYRLARADSAAALALGATPLKPEESNNYSVGFTANAWNTRFALDFYQLDVKHQIGSSSTIGISRVDGYAVDSNGTELTDAQAAIIDNLLASAGLSIADGEGLFVHYFTDIGDTRNTGVDFTAETTRRTDWGRFRFSFAANFNNVKIIRLSEIPDVLKDLPNISSLSLSNQYNLKYRAPKDKQVVGITFDRGPWTIDWHTTRYGELKRYSSIIGEYNIGDSYISDLSIGYQIKDNLKLTLAANNIFDVYPSKVPEAARTSASKAQYDYVWDNSGPVGLNGGSYNVRINYTF